MTIILPAFFGVQQVSSSHANVPVHQVAVQPTASVRGQVPAKKKNPEEGLAKQKGARRHQGERWWIATTGRGADL
jgi:hypothetical protein